MHSASDVRAVLAARQVVHGRYVSLHGRVRRDPGPGRVAVVAGRRVGKAVDRNRAKRRLRAVLQSEGIPSGVDLVVMAKATAVTVPYANLAAEYRKLRGRLLARLEQAA